MRIDRRIASITQILLFVMAIGQAFSQQLVFNTFISPNGQSPGSATGFIQDLNGAVWFGSGNGLYSYDGFQLKTFQNNPLNPNSPASNSLLSICADNKGMIWIGNVDNGLDRYNPETGNFTHFVNDPNDSASLSNDKVAAMLVDKDGTLWIGTHGGLDKYDPETNTFSHHKFDANDSTSLSNDQVRVIYEDGNGTLWIGTGSPWPGEGGLPEEGGLNRMNKETGTFTRYMHDSDNNQSLFNNKVSAIFEDNAGTFWIGTWKNGIQKMDRKKGTFEPAFSESELPQIFKPHIIPGFGPGYDYIKFFIQDATGSLWFGTYRSGLYNYDPVSKKTMHYYGPENSSSGFSDDGTRSAFISRDGIVWISTGTGVGNIYTVDPSIKKISYTSIAGASVGSFYEEPNGDFWIGTKREIIRNIKNSGVTKHYTTDDYDFNAPSNLGYMVYGDREGNIWVGTTQSLNRFDKKTEKFISYKHDPENNSSISDNNALTVYEDSKSNFWVGTSYGLNLMNRETGTFKRFYVHPELKKNADRDVILSITEDRTGKLWVSYWNGGGVCLLNPESKEFKDYLRGTAVWKLFLDSDGVLWAGGQQGLYKYDSSADNFIPFTTSGSATNIPRVGNIAEDKQKNLWLTTDNQIVRINPERDEISFFGQNFGVGKNAFNSLAGYKKNNGEIYFGDVAGYFSFSPDRFIENLKTPEIIFTDFHLLDKKLVPGDGGPLHEKLNDQKEIKLQYNQNVFSFDFTIVDYANPAQNRLTYYLENFDVDWHNANAERKAYYFNVPPGKYTLRLKGVNSYGAWAEKKIDIIIMPPWWKTWLAYTIYSLQFIALIFGIDRFQRKRIIRIENEKNRERELKHAKEIEKAYTELKTTQSQLIQSEKMASLGELTAGIAHEIQNPLNFVNNFSEVNKELAGELFDAVESDNKDEALKLARNVIENQNKVVHHGKRAEAIVKSMLLHSRASADQKEPTDINALCDEYLRLGYHGFRARDKSFNAAFKTELDPNLPKITVVPQDIGRVLLNLINNAFQALRDVEKPEVVVITSQTNDKIEIRVKDNGPGISDTIKEKIFQPFFTTKPAGQGTGLGLSLSYDIAKAHGGEIKLKTVDGGGSEFIVSLPLA